MVQPTEHGPRADRSRADRRVATGSQRGFEPQAAVGTLGVVVGSVVRRQKVARSALAIGHAAGMLELLTLLLGVLPAALRSRRDLVLENLLLRHQLSVAARPRRRPRLRTWDKVLWLLGRRLSTDWRRHLILVTPETVIRWHRQGWRLFWRWRSRSSGGLPLLSAHTLVVIRSMSRGNVLWGTERYPAEL